MNGPESRPDASRAVKGWEEVIFPSYRILEPQKRSECKPRWLERLQAKDLTEQIRGES